MQKRDLFSIWAAPYVLSMSIAFFGRWGGILLCSLSLVASLKSAISLMPRSARHVPLQSLAQFLPFYNSQLYFPNFQQRREASPVLFFLTDEIVARSDVQHI